MFVDGVSIQRSSNAFPNEVWIEQRWPRRARSGFVLLRTHWSLTHPSRLPPVGVTAKTKWAFPLYAKMGREKGKEAKTILIFAGSLSNHN